MGASSGATRLVEERLPERSNRNGVMCAVPSKASKAAAYSRVVWNLRSLLLCLLVAQSRAAGNFEFGTNIDPSSPSKRMSAHRLRGPAGSWRSHEEQQRCEDPDLPANPTALHVASTGEEMEWEGGGRDIRTVGSDEHIEASHGFAPAARRKSPARLQIEGGDEASEERGLREEAQKLQKLQGKTSETLQMIAKQNAENLDLVKDCEEMLASDTSSWTQEARRELQELMRGVERERSLLASAAAIDQKARELLTTDPLLSQLFDPPSATHKRGGR